MTLEEYKQLLDRGNFLFKKVGDDLNSLSTEFIRRQPNRFRREEDFDELCIALALFEKALFQR